MNCIEIVGGIKQEPRLIKEEHQENDPNTVQISLGDIIGKEQVSSEESEASDDEHICPKKNVIKKERVVLNHDRNEDTAKTVNIEHANDGCEKNNKQNKVLYIKIERVIDKIESVEKKIILISSSQHVRLGEPNSSCNENNLDTKAGILTEGQNRKEQEENEVLHINFPAENDKLQQLDKQRDLSFIVRNHEIIFEAPNRFICVHCKTVHKKKKYVNKHIRMQHRENVQMIQCPHCPYKSKYTIKHHLISAHTDLDKVEWFHCHQCDLKFKLKSGLRRHIYTRHMDPMAYGGLKKCTVCDKGFKINCDLRKHMQRVHDKVPHGKKKVCQICNYSATIKEQLENHIEMHHTDINKLETLKCDQCKYTTKFKKRFIAHKTVHGKKNLQCHICAYQTNCSDKLKLHLISHQKEKKEEDLKFKCTKCSYKTYRRYSLWLHELKHKKPSEIQYFYCYHCPFKANRKDNLQSHIFRHYKQNDVTHSCYMCQFKTDSKSGLIKHLNKHSKKKK